LNSLKNKRVVFFVEINKITTSLTSPSFFFKKKSSSFDFDFYKKMVMSDVMMMVLGLLGLSVVAGLVVYFAYYYKPKASGKMHTNRSADAEIAYEKNKQCCDARKRGCLNDLNNEGHCETGYNLCLQTKCV